MHHHLSRRQLVHAALLASAGLGACSSPLRLPAGAAAALAPTAKLRASINLGNPILARGSAPLEALKAHVEWAKRSGYVADALARHRIEGAIVAPAA
jgi:hypothetical protein